jgi:predicted neuraminidase
MSRSLLHIVLAIVVAQVSSIAFADEASRAVLKSEFIADDMPTPSCHASTIAQSGDVLVAAWFGGKAERDPSVGIWVARDEGTGWAKPVEVANGVWGDGKRYACWNPVLFQPSRGPLLLFYKVGPSPSKWWGMMTTSEDHGATWAKPTQLPEGILGPIKDKPFELADGTILCPSSTEGAQGWRLHMEWTKDLGKTWEKSGPLNDGKEFGAIQPTILKLTGGDLALVCRSEQGKILYARSKDQGRTWSPLAALEVPNPNSGIDAVTLADGRHVLVYNDTPKGRTPLKVAVSDADGDGVAWRNVLTLESQPGEYSYPAIIQTADGRVHITYTWKRLKVRHVVLDPGQLGK